MKYSDQKPPNWDELVRLYGASWGRTVVTYGDTVHAARHPNPDTCIHECVHIIQQTSFEGGAEAWWKRYHEDPAFRLAQELEAYQTQGNFLVKEVKDRNVRVREIDRIARDLAKSYNLPLTFDEARTLIMNKGVRNGK